MALSLDVLDLDVDAAIAEISASVRSMVARVLHRRGAVVAVSGGIDSAACAGLCAHALGSEHVVALLMPERDSSPEALNLGRQLAESLDIRSIEIDIAPALDALGCSDRQAEAIRTAFPEFGDGWRFKVALPPILDRDRLNLTRLIVDDPSGTRHEAQLGAAAYRQLVAATNFKQRVRTAMAYYHADALHYAVCGTPNRLEYDQGFFVKGGDGLADFKPIAHLYKTQVYAIARPLGVPDSILTRPPTTDTFSLPQSQEEFYFSLPYEQMDLCLYAFNHGIPADDVAATLGLTAEQVGRVYADIVAKRRTTRPLHLPAQLVRTVDEITADLRP
jgi:NAD+ synthase